MAQKDVGNKVPIYKLKTTKEVMDYYDEWGENDKYNKDMVDWNYTGPKETVNTFLKYGTNKDALILAIKDFKFGYLKEKNTKQEKSIEDLLFYQNGNSVFKEVCPMVAEFISTHLKDNNISPSDVSKFWLHQANSRMVNLIVSKVIGTDDFDTSLAPLPIEKFGNLASAGSMFAFNLHNDLEKGDKGIICSFGAGYSVCSIIVEKQ